MLQGGTGVGYHGVKRGL